MGGLGEGLSKGPRREPRASARCLPPLTGGLKEGRSNSLLSQVLDQVILRNVQTGKISFGRHPLAAPKLCDSIGGRGLLLLRRPAPKCRLRDLSRI